MIKTASTVNFSHQIGHSVREAVRRACDNTSAQNLILQTFFNGNDFKDALARALLKLFGERRDFACALVSRQAFDAPHWKEQICQPDERFVMRHRARPILESVEIKPA